jgi:glycosyltransferase involved in cell wall biosynthesis
MLIKVRGNEVNEGRFLNSNSALPLVSVMVITYNQKYIINETIESILAEPRYPNLEIVIADDCSTDGSQDSLLQLQQKYPSIIKLVLNKENLGITGNSNAAFFATTGTFVAILGGDDIFLPGKINAQIKLFLNDPNVSISYHAIEIFDDRTGEVLAVTDQKRRLLKKDVYDIVAKCGIAGASSIMVRRSACPEYGFDERLPVVSDWKFSIDVAFKGRVAFLDGIYGRYRKTGSGASERTFQLLDESLLALELAQAEHPDDQKLKVACQKGSSRYIAGEVYRALNHYPERAIALANRMVSHHKSPLTLSIWIATWVAVKVTFIRKFIIGFGKFISKFFK